MMSKHLPQELVEEILLKLPMKSLVRFSSVSKGWWKTITTFKPVTNRTLFLLNYFQDGFCVRNDGTIEEYVRHAWDDENEVQKKMTRKRFFQCCGNGLLCFYDEEFRLSLWNPSIRRSIVIEKTYVQPLQRFAYGVVVDHITNDYKILRSYSPQEFLIFRMSTGSWQVLRHCQDPFYGLELPQVDLKGLSYWVGVDFHHDLVLVSFDGHAESFRTFKIDLPRHLPRHPPRRPLAGFPSYWLECTKYLLLFNESLVFVQFIDIEDDDSSVVRDVENRHFSFKESVVFIHTANNDDYDVDDSGRLFFRNGSFMSAYKIWKMDSEAKSVNLWCTITFDENARPLGFRENGQLLWFVGGSKLISTDLEMGSHTCLGNKSGERVFSCPNYVESLALLNAPKFQTRYRDRDRNTTSVVKCSVM